MSKKLTKSQQNRRKERAKLKMARAAEYASVVGTDRNRKPDQQDGIRKFNPNKHAHLTHDCGNVGCGRCYPLGSA